MEPERWRQIEQIFHSALEVEESRRAAFLEQACAGGEDLRREVESLLAHHEETGSFIESPALEMAAQALAPSTRASSESGDSAAGLVGKTLSHYRVLEKLGQGGMGVVYKAHDTHLDRPVALKVLRPEVVADRERKRRFVQEAKTASALNHPNILHIYDIDKSDSIDFIAMEYVPGKTLERLVGRKGLKLNDTLKYAAQMADALAAAHAAGIIHRDLKPGNVMVTERGLVKVLDFGLAKLAEPATSELASTATTLEPQTQEGAIVGTVAYMSPEQAQGKKVDTRSDIFSFGSVLYEMIIGQRAFQGETKLSTLSAILDKEPTSVSAMVPKTPPELERLTARCVRKDAERRIQHMGDVKIALEELKEESDSGKLRVAAPPRRISPWAILALVLLVLTVAAITWWLTHLAAYRAGWFSRPSRPEALVPESAQRQLTANPHGDAVYVAEMSPDGKYLAYGDLVPGLHIQAIDTGDTLTLPTPPDLCFR